MLLGIGFASTSEAQAQTRQNQVQQRRRVIVRRYPYRIYRPWGFGFRNYWGYPYGYDPWSSYGFRYSHYVFDDSEEAVEQGYKDGFKTGKSDGKKNKSYDPQRSHYHKEAGFGNFAEVYRPAFARGYQEGYQVGQGERAGE